jgi:hypothetical protein
MTRRLHLLGCLSLAVVAGACGEAGTPTQPALPSSTDARAGSTPSAVITSATGPDYFVQLMQAGTTITLYPGATKFLIPRTIPGGWEVNVQTFVGNAGTAGQVTQYGNLVVYNASGTTVICSSTKAIAPPAPFQKTLIGGYRVFYPISSPPIKNRGITYKLHAFDTQLNGTLQEDTYLGNNQEDTYITVYSGGNLSCY